MTIDASLAARNPLRYRGYCYDTHSGLYYLPARSYDPVSARFLTPDPASPSAGDPLSLNRYAYCVGDPVNASDPTGAVIDVDGDGAIDVEDNASESYIRTSASSSWKNTYRRAARRAGMISAVRDSLAGMTARGIAQWVRWEVRAALANTPSEYVWQDSKVFIQDRINIGVWSFGKNSVEITQNWKTRSSADSFSVTWDPVSWPDLSFTSSKSTQAPKLGVSTEGPAADFFIWGWPVLEGGSRGGTPSLSVVSVTYCMYANTSPLYGTNGVPDNR